MSEGVVRRDAGQMIILGRLGAHEFASRGRVKKQIANGYRRSRVASGVLDVDQLSALDVDTGGNLVIFCLGYEFDFGDRRDRRQCFTAKAECADAAEIFERFDLRRGVSLKREYRVVPAHPLAVVADSHQAAAAEFDVDLDASSTGVDGVFDKLLDHGRGPLDDLASRDLICQIIR